MCLPAPVDDLLKAPTYAQGIVAQDDEYLRKQLALGRMELSAAPWGAVIFPISKPCV